MSTRLAQHWPYNYPVNIMRKLPSTASLAIAAGLAVAFSSAVEADPGVSIIMSVRASVSPSVVMKFEASPMQLSVTEDDIVRGYVDVPGDSRLTIDTDKTLRNIANITLDYEPNPYNFTSIQIARRSPQTVDPSSDAARLANVQVAARTLQTGEPRSDAMLPDYLNGLPATAAGPSGEQLEGAQAVNARGSVTSLGYRLMLPAKIKPGKISVPLTLSLQL